ncbi:MAG: dicarboxylate/amino acid:cation symporter [Muribaculaceae bacterium]|nr:dicarboxylate/amino acid:cation symporter [Muribaculaceae bacterium]
MKFLSKLGLLPRIIIAIAAGIGAGFIFPDWLARVFITFNGIFGVFLGFLIPLLIVGFVAPAIADLGRQAGRMLVVTAAIAYAMTFAVGMGAYATASFAFPRLIKPEAYVTDQLSSAANTLAPFFSMDIDPMFSVMTALVLAFLLGLGVANIGAGALRRGLEEFRDLIRLTIDRIIIPCLPLYIFGIFMSMSISGEVGTVLLTFSKIIVVIFVMHIAVLVIQYVIAWMFTGLNPFRSLKIMMPAYFTALGTQSSAATIPVTLEQTVRMGVDRDIAGFVIPLCATIHMSGSTLKIVSCALALMILHGIPYSPTLFAGFIAMLAITIIAAPGVPGGAIMASLGLLSSMLGFSQADNALMIALYISMDSFGTACNITGDGAIAQIVGRIFRKPVNPATA